MSHFYPIFTIYRLKIRQNKIAFYGSFSQIETDNTSDFQIIVLVLKFYQSTFI